MPPRSPAPSLAYQLKITIGGIRPPVWRRVRVAGSLSLEDLHWVIQASFGWEDCHLHEFLIGDARYGPRQLEDAGDERKARLAKVLGDSTKRLLYVYDFGDDWQHDILVEKVVPAERGAPRAVCLAGKRHGPPEDCGGPWGYAEFLEAIGDPKHPEHESMIEWGGDDFDPEAFDLDAVNARI